MSARVEFSLDELPERYAFLDPASGRKVGENKKARARQAIAVVAPDSVGRIFALSLWAGRDSTDELIDRIFSVYATFRPQVFGCEANAMQSLFADAVLREARKEKLRLPLSPIFQSTRVDKIFRIRTILQPIISTGRLFLPDTMSDEDKKEITGFPLTHRFDLIDALASACASVPARSLERSYADTEKQARERYLQRSAGILGNQRRGLYGY